MADFWAVTPGKPFQTDTYNQATGITNTLALPDNTSGPTYDGFGQGFNVRMAPFNAVGDGVVDDTAAILAAQVAAAAASPAGVVLVPIGNYLISSTVAITASMRGLGGVGYSSNTGAARFITSINDGTPTFKGLNTNGIDLRDFMIEGSTGSNPHVSSGNVRSTTGLQLGKPNSLLSTAVVKTTSTSVTVTTKYQHYLAVGDVVYFDDLAVMTDLNSGSGTYTIVTVPSVTTFTVATANNAGWGAHTANTGWVYLADASLADCSRGSINNVTCTSLRTGFALEGWLSDHNIRAYNCTVGLNGSQLNSNNLALIAENCWQGFQLTQCVGLNISRINEEGGAVNDTGASSTIDACTSTFCPNYESEGGRSAVNPWMVWGGVSLNIDTHFPYGLVGTSAGSVSVGVNRCNRYTLPAHLKSGYTTTANSFSGKGTATFAAGTTVAVTFAHTQLDAVYYVFLTAQADPTGTRLWVSSKATTGFTINSSSSNSAAVDWMVVRD